MLYSLFNGTSPATNRLQPMNQEQLTVAFQLVSLMDGDDIAQADANSFGEWHRHLIDHLLDAMADGKA